MDKTSKLLIGLCFVLIIAWYPISNKLWPPKPLQKPAPASTNVVTQAEAAPGRPQAAEPAATEQTAPLATGLKALPADKFATLTLENDDLIVHFSAKGGGIASVYFPKYEVKDEPPAAINEQAPTTAFDLSSIGGLELGTGYRIEKSGDGRQVTATLETPTLSVVKTYRLKQDQYQLVAEIKLTNKSSETLTAGFGEPALLSVGTANPLSHLDTGYGLGFDWFTVGDKYVKGTLSSVSKHPFAEEATSKWVAVKNQFFVLLITPDSEPFTGIRAEAVPYDQSKYKYARKNQKGIFTLAELSPLKLAPGETHTLSFDTYLGPRDYKRLEALGGKQDDVMDYGMWSFFCKILLGMMVWFHGWMGNWGLAIIAMTVVIKGVFWPLTNVSTRSMKRMQALSPKLKELQEKYKDDREKIGLETMKLYREYGVNPLGGCLPMLIQIPIFFALFTMLRTTVQLRGAHFLWIHDLSMPDTIARIPFPVFKFLWWDLGPIPVNPMPLIMVVCQIWQMRIMPASTTDPSQKMMMWMMPAVFLLICYNFSSALALYWTIQTLLQALQTYLIKKQPEAPLQRVKKPKAKSTGMTFGRPLEKKKKR